MQNQPQPAIPGAQPPPSMALAAPIQRLLAYLVNALILFFGGPIMFGIGFLITGSDILGGIVIGFLAVFGYAVAQIYLISTRGQDIGKIALNIKIVRIDGSDLGITGMLLREIVGKAIPASIPIINVIWLLSYVWILIDDNHQGWHDKIANTYVVSAAAR